MKKIDFHIHLTNEYPTEKSVENIKEMCNRHGYETICLQTITHLDHAFVTQPNEAADAVKKLLPDIFIFGGIVHDGTSYVKQAEQLIQKGVDGIKLLIGKPSEYRDLGVTYEDPIVDEFFSYAQSQDVPVLLHHNDPEFHWDKSKMSKESIDRGWYYDSGFLPSHEDFNIALEKLLQKYPKLRIAIAHLGFYSNKLDRLTRLMETYPGLYMDITPALDIYADLSREPVLAKDFFHRFSDRLIYGTDGWSDLGEHEGHRSLNDKKVKIIDHFLCRKNETVIDGQYTIGIGLSKAQLEDIYYNNCLRFMKKNM